MASNPRNDEAVEEAHDEVPSTTGDGSRARPRRGPTQLELKRRRWRSELWPNADLLHFDRRRDVGFTSVPRSLPIVCAIIKHLTLKGEGDASRAYLDLWGRVFDEGLVDVADESEMALACGFAPGKRLTRSWRDRIAQLRDLGFVLVKPKPGREFGHILVLHPHDVVERIRRDRPGAIPDYLLEVYDARLREIGARDRSLAIIDKQLARARGAAEASGGPGFVDLE